MKPVPVVWQEGGLCAQPECTPRGVWHVGSPRGQGSASLFPGPLNALRGGRHEDSLSLGALNALLGVTEQVSDQPGCPEGDL